MTIVKEFHIILALVLLLCTNTEAHTNLAWPLPTRGGTCRLGGEEFKLDCPGPCPKVWSKTAKNTRKRPAATWKRGQIVPVRWQKNNHDGGFVRLTLVPVKKYMDKQAHADYAFWWGCYNTGMYKCKNRGDKWECGTDEDGLAFRTKVKVPENLVDGNYVFGMTWYGGVKWTNKDSYFSDYWACSHIRIEGGASLKKSWEPFWNGRKCKAGVNRLGECTWEPCEGKGARMMKPAEFEGKEPPKRENGGDNLVAVNGGEVVELKVNDEDNESNEDDDFQEEKEDHSRDLSIKRLHLHETPSNKRIPHDFKKPIDPKKFPGGFTLVAEIGHPTKNINYVDFYLDGKKYHRESKAPYTLSGDSRGKMHRWKYPEGKMVNIKVKVVLYSRDSIERSFKVYLKQ